MRNFQWGIIALKDVKDFIPKEFTSDKEKHCFLASWLKKGHL